MTQELIEIKLSVPQIFILRQMLELEINTGMKMSRHETALAAFKRLTGYDPGRGKKGRQEALAVLAKFETGEDDE
jgi:hypothetical protein